MSPLLRFILDNIQLVILLLFVLSSLFSFVGRIGRASQEAQREAERQRQRSAQDAQRRETSPDTQSYQGYLERTRSDKLERADDGDADLFPNRSGGLFADDVQQAGGMTEQERLRREMARKMGRTLPNATTAVPASPSVPPKPQSPWGDLLRELSEAFDQGQQPDTFGQPAKPEQAKPKPKPKPRPPSAPKVQQPRIESRLEAAMQPTVNVEGEAALVDVGRASKARTAANANPATASSIGSLIPKSSQDVTRAIIWSEILGPPRSRRR